MILAETIVRCICGWLPVLRRGRHALRAAVRRDPGRAVRFARFRCSMACINFHPNGAALRSTWVEARLCTARRRRTTVRCGSIAAARSPAGLALPVSTRSPASHRTGGGSSTLAIRPSSWHRRSLAAGSRAPHHGAPHERRVVRSKDRVVARRGKTIAYRSDRDGPPDVLVQDVDAGTPPRTLYATPGVDDPVCPGCPVIDCSCRATPGWWWSAPTARSTRA